MRHRVLYGAVRVCQSGCWRRTNSTGYGCGNLTVNDAVEGFVVRECGMWYM